MSLCNSIDIALVINIHFQFSRIITSGSDGDIRIWHGIDDDDPNSECIGEFVICIVHYPDRILASTDLNTVQVIFVAFIVTTIKTNVKNMIH